MEALVCDCEPPYSLETRPSPEAKDQIRAERSSWTESDSVSSMQIKRGFDETSLKILRSYFIQPNAGTSHREGQLNKPSELATYRESVACRAWRAWRPKICRAATSKQLVEVEVEGEGEGER